MNQEERKPYYVDFARSGGVVESSPTRMLPDLVFTERRKSELELQLEQHTRMVQDMLGESAWKGRRLIKTVAMARRVFLDLSLTEHGIVELKDSFYTGWFYTVENGKMYSALREKDDVPLSPHAKKIQPRSYFLLDRKEAESWNRKIKQNPLTIEEVDRLFLSPGIEVHTYYQSLARLNLKELTDRIISITDSFWDFFKTFDRNDKSAAKGEFLRDNLLNLEILKRVHNRSHKAALGEIRESMERNEITVFPIGQGGCVVRYISDLEDKKDKGSRQTTTRTFPLPQNLMRPFQRYGRLGERPMTKGEFETLYRRLVDPNTKLFT